MRNKIFLTSLLAICVACPAFATPGVSNGWGYIESTDSQADCAATPLTADGTAYSSGTYTFTATWNPNVGQITLVSNVYSGNDTTTTPLVDVDNGTQTATTYKVNPSVIWSKYDVGLYTDSATTTVLDFSATGNHLPAAEGYTFQGFYKGGEGTAQMISNTGAYSIDPAAMQITSPNGTDIWYAHWTPTTYRAIYNSNQCTETSNLIVTRNDAVTYGVTYIAEAFGTAAAGAVGQPGIGWTAKEGYSFCGWGAGANMSCETTTTSSFITATTTAGAAMASPWSELHDVQLYAICRPIDYNVMFNCGTYGGTSVGGTAPATMTGKHVDDSVSLYSTASDGTNSCTVPSGTTFKGWNCYRYANNTNGTQVGTSSTTSITMPASDVMCYAQWGNVYDITYNCVTPNGWTGAAFTNSSAPAPSTGLENGSSYTLPTSVDCVLPGATFAGWSCNHSLTTTSATTTPYMISDGTGWNTGTFGASTNVSCDTVWSTDTIQLRWVKTEEDWNNGVSPVYYGTGTLTQSCSYGTANTILTPAAAQPTRDGYTFTGWEVIHHD